MKPESCCGASSAINLQTDHAAIYANRLLADLGEEMRVATFSDHPALAYRRCALLQTTGLMLPLPLAAHADGALMALGAVSNKAEVLPQKGSALLGERARLRQTVRQGRWCAGGYGRLLDTCDGRIALNLVRDDDWDLIPAWLEEDISDWDGIADAVKKCSATLLAERAAELGLAVSVDKLPSLPISWFQATTFTSGVANIRPLIVDLSGLWVGPLASSLLGMIGARVVKVESPTRPDGMRFGHQGFYELINGGKSCVALDFRNAEDLASLKRLLERADIVITASRPRAFAQLGIVPDDYVRRMPGKVWAQITAYGPLENRVGFGDDIGIAAGLATVMERTHQEVCFVGDAIADPTAGLHAALAIWSFYRRGGGVVLDFTMRDIVRFAMGEIVADLPDIAKDWQAIANADHAPLYAMRHPKGQAHDLGADTSTVLAELC